MLVNPRRRLVRDVDRAADVRDPRDVELRRLPEQVPQLVDEARLGRIRDRDVVAELGAPQRDREPLAGELFGQRRDGVLLRHLAAQVDDLETELLRDRRRERALVEDLRVDEVLAETQPGTGLPGERLLQLLLGQQRLLDQHLPEALAALRHRGDPLWFRRVLRLGNRLQLRATSRELSFDVRDRHGRRQGVLVAEILLLDVVVEVGRVLDRIDVLREFPPGVLARLEQAHVSALSG